LSEELLDLARQVIRLALDKGAQDAECTLAEGSQFSTTIRMREVETLEEAGSRSAGVRVLFDKRVGSSYTSDLTPEGIQRMVRSAVDLAQLTSEDPFAGLPDPAELGSIDTNLDLYSDDVDAVSAAERIEFAKRAEAAAFDTDPRIANSEGASFGASQGARYFANSRGFSGWYRGSSCSVSVVPVAKEGDTMERDYWYSASRRFAGLESPEHVGRMAAQRAVRRLNARKVPTQKVPIVYEPRTARALLGEIFGAIAGDSIYRKASFLQDKLGETVASPQFTVIDDPTIPGLFGSQPFDDEGVPSRRTTVIENGVLQSYLLNCYTARKLGLKTTGSASRGITGNASVGHGNFYLQAGSQTPEQIIAEVKTGFYVTELIGSGVNTVTGDYSLGAAGVWIENGELAFPVSEVTIAGNLKQMLRDVDAIGSDLEFRSSMAAPTLRIREMTVSGQ
jgi:PmbA protein